MTRIRGAIARLLTILTLLILGLVPCAALAQTNSLPWVGSWASAPSKVFMSQIGVNGLTFSQQTIRQYVLTGIGGTAVRLHFSNQYGDAPLIIQDVHFALVASQVGDIQPATNRIVTFKGSTSITIPAGQTVVSDPIAETVPARTYAAISTYFPGPTPTTLTMHVFSYQGGQFANGDMSSSTMLPPPPGGQYPIAWYFLTGLDVQSPTALGSLVQLGASVTDGFNSTLNANRRWGNALQTRLQSARVDVGVLDEGIPGSNMLSDNNPIYGEAAVNRFQRDVLDQPGVRWVVYSEYNDVSVGADKLEAGLKGMIAKAHAAGLKFICSTTTPFSAPGQPSGYEPIRQAYNAFVRTYPGCDLVIDQDAALRNPADPASYLPQYDSGDHLHPNDAGYAVIGGLIDPSFFTQPGLASSKPSTLCGRLLTGQTIEAGGTLTSCDKRFSLSLGTDGGLVLRMGPATLWSAQTSGAQVRMTQAGSLVATDANGRPTWTSGSDGNPNAWLALQNDGNLVIYTADGKPVWYTRTYGH